MCSNTMCMWLVVSNVNTIPPKRYKMIPMMRVREREKKLIKSPNEKWNEKPKYCFFYKNHSKFKNELNNTNRMRKKNWWKSKINEIKKNTSLFRFDVCGVVMWLIVCELVVDGMIASFSVVVDAELVDVSDSFDFCSWFAGLFG